MREWASEVIVLYYGILFGPFLSFMRQSNVWLVSDCAVMAAVIEIAKNEEDALVSCLVVFSVRLLSEILQIFSHCLLVLSYFKATLHARLSYGKRLWLRQ